MDSSGNSEQPTECNLPVSIQHALPLLSLLGPAGSVIQGSITTWINRREVRNLREMIGQMSSEIKSNKDFNSGLLKTEDFQAIFHQACDFAMEQHRRERRLAAGVLLGKTACSDVLNYAIISHFLKVLMTLSDVEFVTLGYLCKKGTKTLEDDYELWISYSDIETHAATKNSEASKLCVPSLESLASLGLIETRGSGKFMVGTNPVGLWRSSRYSSTKLATDFMDWIEISEFKDIDTSEI